MNRANAEIYVGDGLVMWGLATVIYFAGMLDLIFLMLSIGYLPLFVFFLIILIILLWESVFGWKHFVYTAVFVCDNEICFYKDGNKQSISCEQIMKVAPWQGNIAYTFLEENDEKLFTIQMKKKNAQELLQYIADKSCGE
jgi:hypothetical protein